LLKPFLRQMGEEIVRTALVPAKAFLMWFWNKPLILSDRKVGN